MATSGLYGSSPTGAVISAPGSESAGLYGNGTTFGGSYFEWFIFIQADTQPATPTGGSWSFSTNSGTPPTGWSSTPPAAPTLPVWVSIALVNSKNASTLEWSAPGVFSYSSGLPILSGTGSPTSGDGLNNQLWIQTGTTPETIWFKQSGTWVRLSGSTLYVDTSSNQTVGGTKTFSNVIVGSVSGTANNVTGIVSITNGGTGQTSANSAFNALAPSQTGNSGKFLTTDGTDTSWSTNPLGTVTSVAVSGGTTGLTTSGGPITTSGTITLAGTLAVANGGTGATTANGALTNLGGIGDITSTDGSVTITPTGTSRDLSVAVAAATNNVICQVRNATGATLTKGTVVYISGGTGQLPTVSKALATTDATSAQTLGMMTADLANNSNGNVTIIGLITNIDTSAYTDGQQLYLSGTTAGTVTATKPYAPIHLVYVAVVEHAHPTQGKLFVKVQNGYELDELHNVSAQSPTTGQTIVYNSATTLWEKNTVSLTAGVNGTLPIANGGTGQTTANAAFNALAPSQTGNSGKYLTTDGSNTSWATNPLGTVTSVSGTGTVNGLTLTGTVTTSGSLTLGGTLSGIANSALTNSSITIGGTTIALGGSSNALANDITINSVTVGRGAGADQYNTALGVSALSANTTGGSQNVAVGWNALLNNTTGTNNTAVGMQSLKATTTGSNNSAIGLRSLQANTTGAYNTGLGNEALYSNTTASYNTAVGYQAGYYNTTGAYNSAFGYASLITNTTGNYNVAYGSGSLQSNTTASNNTAVGYQAGYSQTTADGNALVGYQAGTALTTGNLNSFFGAAAGGAITTGAKNTILGRYNGNQGGLDIRTATGYVVLSDGEGRPLLSTVTTASVALEGATPTTGTGISFPATQNASSNANTLDDYEEGSWTPTIVTSGTNPTVSYAAQTGWYVKVGRLVTIYCDVEANSISGGSGSAFIGGLPFSSSASPSRNYPVPTFRDCTGIASGGANTVMCGFVQSNANYVFLQYNSCNGSYGSGSAATWASAGRVTLSVIYQAAN
jgi:hypothetical protein